MYTAFHEAHRGLAMIGCLTTVLWAFVALVPPLANRPVPGVWRPLFIAAIATTGLSGVTGLVVLWMGDGLTYIFPWLGFVAVALHSMAGARGRRALAAGATLPLAGAIVVQIASIFLAYGLMVARPF